MKLISTNSNLLLIVAVSALLTGCSAQQQELRDIPPPSPLEMVQPTPAYIIQPGDQLDVKFFFNPELNESVTVRPDGKISLQLVDEVQAAGLQPAALDEMLTRQYSRELKKPMVTGRSRSLSNRFPASASMWAGKSTSSAK